MGGLYELPAGKENAEGGSQEVCAVELNGCVGAP